MVTMVENSLFSWHELLGQQTARMDIKTRMVWVGLESHGDRTAPEMFPLAGHESLCQGDTWILG